MGNIWFTADTHFGHCNIIRYCNRPCKDADEMDALMLARFCEVLRPGDVLYHLGDVCHTTFNSARFFGGLPTKEIHLIYGNHDKVNILKHPNIRWAGEIKRISIEGQGVTLFHYAMRTWANKGRGAFQLYGHSHGSLPGLGRQMDVGVDTNNFYPYSWEEIKKRLLPIEYSVTEDERTQPK
jgi:calcineurin-like phosphoesterase family protein